MSTSANGFPFEGALPGVDMGIQRKPYHKNCKCALHKSRNHCTRHSDCDKVSYPIRRSWSEGCLALLAHAPPSSSHSSPCSPAGITRTQTQLVLCLDEVEEEEEESVSLSIAKLKV